MCHQEVQSTQKEEVYSLGHNLTTKEDVSPPNDNMESAEVMKSLVDHLAKK